jgi:DNA repair exonuclease SbcCD ATPase subunit
MLHEFEQIEAQKTRLFEAVNEKEAQSKQIEQRKLAMEERIAKLEQEAHNYQRNFAEYNRRIEEHTMRLLELAQKEKATEAYLETLLKDEAEMLLRVAELEKVYSRLCVGVQLAGGHPDPRIGSLVKDKVDEIMSRLETLSSADKALHTERQLARKLKM